MRDFAKIAKPISYLLKKSVSEIWDEHCYRAFGELKRRLTSVLVLKFSEFKKPFEVHTNTSDFAIGGVLMSRPSHNLSKNGRAATSRDTGVTNQDLRTSRGATSG